jgi:spermidine synthase
VKPCCSRTWNSEKNGKIVVKRWFGNPEIEVDGYVQSGEYMRSLWSEALWRANSNPHVKSVLLLGLGCGSAIQVMQSRFPDCDITAVEWDPIMVALASQLKLFSSSAKLKVLSGDAFVILPQITQRFDLVLIDLFRGDAPESRLSSQAMVCSIAQVITPPGQIILNAFKDCELIGAFARHLDFVRHWRFRNNHMALFQLFNLSKKYGHQCSDGCVRFAA